jgi:hypothetical protein
LHYFYHHNGIEDASDNLQLQLGASPMTSLSVVSDFVASTHSDPLWDGAILLKLLRQLLLDPECLVGRHLKRDEGKLFLAGCLQIFFRLEFLIF